MSIKSEIFSLRWLLKISPSPSIGIPVFTKEDANAAYVAQTNHYNVITEFEVFQGNYYLEFIEFKSESIRSFSLGNHIVIPFWVDEILYLADCSDIKFRWLSAIPRENLSHPVVCDVISAVKLQSDGYRSVSEPTQDLTREFINEFSDILSGTIGPETWVIRRFHDALKSLNKNRDNLLTPLANIANSPYAEEALHGALHRWFMTNRLKLSRNQIKVFSDLITPHVDNSLVSPQILAEAVAEKMAIGAKSIFEVQNYCKIYNQIVKKSIYDSLHLDPSDGSAGHRLYSIAYRAMDEKINSIIDKMALLEIYLSRTERDKIISTKQNINSHNEEKYSLSPIKFTKIYDLKDLVYGNHSVPHEQYRKLIIIKKSCKNNIYLLSRQYVTAEYVFDSYHKNHIIERMFVEVVDNYSLALRWLGSENYYAEIDKSVPENMKHIK